MSKENMGIKGSDNLNRYGVWVKKTPSTPSPKVEPSSEEFNFFSDTGIDYQSPEVSDNVALEPVSSDDVFFDMQATTESDELEVLNYDDSVSFSDIELDSHQDTTFVKTEQEHSMNFDSDELEKIDLDDFLSDASPLDTSSSEPTSHNKVEAVPTEEISVESFGLSSEEPLASNQEDDSKPLDLDISFEAPQAKQETARSESSGSSAFDDMLDELTASGDDIVEVSLDDFMDELEAPKSAKDEEEEVFVRPEPKTTVEEFSLDSIKSSNTASKSNASTEEPSTPPTSAPREAGSFEDISLDDFFSSETDSVGLSVESSPSVATSSQHSSNGISLSISDEAETSGMQEMSITASNEVDDIGLFDDVFTEKKPSMSTENSETVLDMGFEEPSSVSLESNVGIAAGSGSSDLPDFDAEPVKNSGETKLTEGSFEEISLDDFDNEFSIETAPTTESLSPSDTIVEEPTTQEPTIQDPIAQEPDFDDSFIEEAPVVDEVKLGGEDVADLTAIVEETPVETLSPTSPDFETELEIDNDFNARADDDVDFGSSLQNDDIAKNEAFDDVNALTNDLLSTSDSLGLDSSPTQDSVNVSADLLKKLTDEISSMKNEIASLKAEMHSAKASESVKVQNGIASLEEPSFEEPNFEEPSFDTSSESSELDLSIETPSDTFASEPTETITNTLDLEAPLAEVPIIDEFETSAEPELTSELGILDPEPKQETGFFSDDAIDDTIALTGDELNNILNTADFVEEQNPDEFDIPEVLNLDDTFSADDEKEEASQTELEMEEVDLDAFTNDETLNVHDDLPNEEAPDFDVEPITTLDENEDTSFLTESVPEIPELEEEPGETLIDIHTDGILADALAAPEDFSHAEPIITDEDSSFDTADLDSIVEDIPAVDLDIQSLDERTASTVEQKLSTVQDELSHPSDSLASLPIDMKEEIKSVLTYMDQLLESLPEEKIEEFAKSEYFETYKKLFDELGIS